MDKLKMITDEIAGFYPKLQSLKAEEEIYKEIIKEKYNDAFKDRKKEKTVCQGMVLHYKTRKNWKWDPNFYDVLEEKSILPFSVKITKDATERHILDDFKLPASKYVRISPRRQTNNEKLAEEGRLSILKTDLRNKSLEEVVNHFKVLKIKIKQNEQKYDKRKNALLNEMLLQKKEHYKCPMGNGYKLLDNKVEYDFEKMAVSEIPKRFNFSYKILSIDGDVEVEDHFKKEIFQFTKETIYEGQRLTLERGRLFINGVRLETDIRSIFKGGFYPAKGIVPVKNSDFFRKCKISSTNLEKFLDDGTLLESEVSSHRYLEDGETGKEYFEVISEISEQERTQHFRDKLELRRKLFSEKQNTTIVEEDENEGISLFDVEFSI